MYMTHSDCFNIINAYFNLLNPIMHLRYSIELFFKCVNTYLQLVCLSVYDSQCTEKCYGM